MDHIMDDQLQTKIGSNPTLSSADGTDMEGVEAEVSLLAVHDHMDQEQPTLSNPPSMQNDEDESMGEDDSKIPGLCEDDGSDFESGGDSEDEKNNDDNQAQENIVGQDSESEEQESQEQSSSAASSLPTEPSIITMSDAIYSAVPVSSELHIIPHSSKGFNWNEDLFLKPHQRRSLGVDDMYNTDESSSEGGHDRTVTVHEICLDDEESRQILPA
ncbi:hypothetical protein BGX27_000517 [Mortierella sp. AM989]|nr:hypothetical protein BGX27_000517 [Mortierella sp. AM989]